ncbi:LrgB family protein [Lachnospiraceae bacterium MD308]|jgi:predicted murein hydrolase (TIGR00659 family)|nr:LrgB family protein [Lachnospiraceae bacterium MD308]
MNEFFQDSVTAGVVISLISYLIGMEAKKRWKLPILNPLLISIVLVIGFLLIFKVDYNAYNNSAKYLSYLLTPATVSLAIPLYQQMELLKKNVVAICIGILAGVLTSLGSVLALAVLFHLSHEEYVTLLPKSITTAIGMGVSEELGGYVVITTAVIIITGVLGNMIAELMCRVFRIRHAVSRGIAIGTASHAIGTAKAMEMGEVEGAMSSLAIVLSGLCTVVGATVFASFY